MHQYALAVGLSAAALFCARTADAAVVLTNRQDSVVAGGFLNRQLTQSVGTVASDVVARDFQSQNAPTPGTVTLAAQASGSYSEGGTLVATAAGRSGVTSSFDAVGDDLRIDINGSNATMLTADNLPAYRPDATAQPSQVLLFSEGGYNSDFSFVTTLGGTYSVTASLSDFTGVFGDQFNGALIVFDSAGDGTFATSIQPNFSVAADGSATRTGTLAASANRYRVLFFGNPGRLLRAGDAPVDTRATYGGAFRFTAVPEPTTAGMILFGAVPLLLRRREGEAPAELPGPA